MDATTRLSRRTKPGNTRPTQALLVIVVRVASTIAARPIAMAPSRTAVDSRGVVRKVSGIGCASGAVSYATPRPRRQRRARRGAACENARTRIPVRPPPRSPAARNVQQRPLRRQPRQAPDQLGLQAHRLRILCGGIRTASLPRMDDRQVAVRLG